MKKMFKLDNRGSLTIIFVIVTLVAVIIMSGFLNISMRTVSQNEIQGIMDDGGVVALRQAVDENKLRLEEIVVNENIAKQKYIDIINGSIKSGPNNMIKSYKIDKVAVYPPNSPHLRSLGIPDGERDQYYIESIISVRYMKPSMGADVIKGSIDYFDYLSGFINKKFTNNIDDRGGMTLRSVSRLVLR